LIIVDEGSFIKPEVYLHSIIPVAQGSGIVLIILTTPLGHDNETTRLFNTKDKTGKPVIRAVRIGKSCDACREAKVLCNHVENATAEGLSKRKREAFMNFYEEQKHVAMREFTGETSDDSIEIYKKEWVHRLLARKPFKTPALIDFILVTIDPAQEGACEWGFCACYYDVVTNTQVIIQLDGQHVDDVSPNIIMMWLRDSINHIRRRSLSFATIPIVIACEAAPSTLSRMIQYYVELLTQERSVYNVHVMRESPGDSPGVPKTATNTRHMVEFSAHLLENDQVAFSDVFGSSLAGAAAEMALKEKTKFLQQLVNVKIRRMRSTRQDGMPKLRIDGKGGGMNDDVALAWIMNYYWYLQFMNSSKTDYANIRQQFLTLHPGHVTILSRHHALKQKRTRDRAFEENPLIRPIDIDVDSSHYNLSDTHNYTQTEIRALIDRVHSGARPGDIIL